MQREIDLVGAKREGNVGNRETCAVARAKPAPLAVALAYYVIIRSNAYGPRYLYRD